MRASKQRTCTSLISFSSCRRLPVHCKAAATVCFLNLDFSSSSVKCTERQPSPVGVTSCKISDARYHTLKTYTAASMPLSGHLLDG